MSSETKRELKWQILEVERLRAEYDSAVRNLVRMAATLDDDVDAMREQRDEARRTVGDDK